MRFFRKRCFRQLIPYITVVLVTYVIWAAARWRWADYNLSLKSLSHNSGSRIASTVSTPDRPNDFSINSDVAKLAYHKKWVGFPELSRVDCVAALSKSVKNSMFSQLVTRTPALKYVSDSSDCPSFRKIYGFDRYPKVSREELDFPIAFIILFNKDFDQVAFLLRAIYRSHNLYCLNVDSKTDQNLIQGAYALARCLPNVFVASRLERIVYAGFSRLQADIICMGDLLKHPVKWRYVINMPGQQFPLRTNLEMVKILQHYNGTNDIEGITGHRMLPNRFLYKHAYDINPETGEKMIKTTSEKLKGPPHGFVVVKGSAYGTFSRPFVAFVLMDRRAKDLLKWCESVKSPDEYFWATLHHSKTVPVPGAYTAGKPDNKPWLTVYASWGGVDSCATIRRRSVCIFSPEDLPGLLTRREIFANKFYITHYPTALHCLDQMLYNLTVRRHTREINYYKHFPFIKNA
ncbi:hypothetical protein EGW08_019825 [Elysia chlorotica]|uniref:Protein xylosyltransferase n=1 Tax=Elysia chlorotica TaxID=188477 RepID=A0A433ST25_ELYCH|nr:hypothetical protein EGW08_019825 [Elysia chlorotica]